MCPTKGSHSIFACAIWNASYNSRVHIHLLGNISNDADGLLRLFRKSRFVCAAVAAAVLIICPPSNDMFFEMFANFLLRSKTEKSSTRFKYLILIAMLFCHFHSHSHSIEHIQLHSSAVLPTQFSKSIHLLEKNYPSIMAITIQTDKSRISRHNRYNFSSFFIPISVSFSIFFHLFLYFLLSNGISVLLCCHIQFAILFLQFCVCPAAWKENESKAQLWNNSVNNNRISAKKNRERKILNKYKSNEWRKKKKSNDDSSQKSSLEYTGIENAQNENAYHQSNQNALILMENLYRNEIKCRILLYEPNEWWDPLSEGFLLFIANSVRCVLYSAMQCTMFVVCAVLDGDDSCESSWFCLGRSHPSLSCTYNASLSHSFSFRLAGISFVV